jgi:hypothetical protein
VVWWKIDEDALPSLLGQLDGWNHVAVGRDDNGSVTVFLVGIGHNLCGYAQLSHPLSEVASLGLFHPRGIIKFSVGKGTKKTRNLQKNSGFSSLFRQGLNVYFLRFRSKI